MDLMLFRIGSLLVLCAGTLCGVHHIASFPTETPRTLGLRGASRSRALSRHVGFRFVEPFVRWMSARVFPVMTPAQRDSLDLLLTRAGDPLGIEPAEVVVLCGMLGFSGGTLGAVYAAMGDRSILYAVFLALTLMAFPFARIQGLVEMRAHRVQQGLPAVVDLLCLALSAGLDFPAAVRQIVDKSSQKQDPLTEEFSLVLSELSLGKTRHEALENFAKRNPAPSVSEFVASIIQAEEEGTTLSEVLQIQATVSRQRRCVRAENAASRASLQLLAPMALVFVSVLCLIGGPLVLKLMEEFGRGN